MWNRALVACSLVVAAGLTAVPRPAASQSCCTTTGAADFAVVGRCQDAAIASQLSYERAVGSFDDTGAYRTFDDSDVNDLVLALGGGVRTPYRPLQLYGSVPLRLQLRSLTGVESESEMGVGDASINLRWTPLEDPGHGMFLPRPNAMRPYIDVIAGVVLPTGRAPEESATLSGADVTGTGAWQLVAGLGITKFITQREVLRLQGTYGHAFAREIPGPFGTTREFARGDEIDLRLQWLHIQSLWWSFGLFADLRFTLDSEQDGELIANSDRRRLRFGAHVTWAFDLPLWETTLSVAADPWWNDGGSNVPFAGPTLSLPFRYNVPQ